MKTNLFFYYKKHKETGGDRSTKEWWERAQGNWESWGGGGG